MTLKTTVRRLWQGAHPERPSRLTRAVLLLGAGGLAIALAAGVLNRTGALTYGSALQVFRYAAISSMAGVALGLVALVRAAIGARRRGWRMAAAGVAIAVAWLTVPVYYVTVLYPANPPIHDITTNTEHPPEFVTIPPLRGPGTHPATYGGAEIADQQKKFFPNLAPLRSTRPPAEVFPVAVAAARGLGMDIVAAVPEQGRIEASQRSLFFGFVDDVAIRVQVDGAGTRVDVRSASRVGRSDLGANARRVQHYLAALRSQLNP